MLRGNVVRTKDDAAEELAALAKKHTPVIVAAGGVEALVSLLAGNSEAAKATAMSALVAIAKDEAHLGVVVAALVAMLEGDKKSIKDEAAVVLASLAKQSLSESSHQQIVDSGAVKALIPLLSASALLKEKALDVLDMLVKTVAGSAGSALAIDALLKLLKGGYIGFEWIRKPPLLSPYP